MVFAKIVKMTFNYTDLVSYVPLNYFNDLIVIPIYFYNTKD